MDELLTEFLTETNESLGVLDLELVKLEQNPNSPKLLDSIFRIVHTIKGTCGFLGLPRLETVAHASENVLGKIRDGEIDVSPEAVTLILQALDAIKELVAILERTETEPEGEDGELIAKLDALAESRTVKPGASAATPEDEVEAAFLAAPGPDELASAPSAGDSLFNHLGGAEAIDAPLDSYIGKILDDGQLKPILAIANESEWRATYKGFVRQALGADEGGLPIAPFAGANGRRLGAGHIDALAGHFREALEEFDRDAAEIDEATRALVAAHATVVEAASSASPAAPQTGKANKSGAAGRGDEVSRSSEFSVASQNIRVSVDLLENLMTMVSELVLTRNQLMQLVRGLNDSDFSVPLQRLSHVTTELQEGVMKTRMQPIGNAWAKLPRIVRDLGQELGKKIDLQMIGADTELDRQVLELIKDPLTHMVRNAADHGIESREARREAGKPELGRITLNAYHEGGHIIIEISDDGRGLSVDKIRAKAIANGLTNEAEVQGLSDQQILTFIFRPGFSTAAEVTSVSGRGVGMDVVKTNIEMIGGTAELKSREGKGTNFTIKIPLTLAIVSALIIECAHERFAIPQISVVELVRVSEDTEHSIETINNAPVLRLRDRLLPLVPLRQVLQFPPLEPTDDGGREDSFVVVIQVGNYNFGIVVDKVFDTEEIVVKPVAPVLRSIGVYSGNTILGDGSVIMILDPNGIATASGETSAAEHEIGEAAAQQDGWREERIPLLVFRAGGNQPKAVPLALVARLEEIPVEEIETADGSLMVQYRGRLMPLVKLDQSYELKGSGRQPVLVFSDVGRSMGLAVDEIVDIVEQKLDIELAAKAHGLIGIAVVDGKATEIIDASGYLTEAFADWFHRANIEGNGTNGTARVLLIDDSSFFRNLIAPVLSTAGYDVTTAEDADSALKMRDGGKDFDIIISDIEMPGMDGFEFADAVRNDSRWQHTPLVALSSRATSTDFNKGREVGFSDYVAKYDRDALLAALTQTLSKNGNAP